MTVTLETLQEMWEKDAKIDRDNLHEESLKMEEILMGIFQREDDYKEEVYYQTVVT